MAGVATLEQLQAIMGLNEGDKVLLTNGGTYTFIRAKKTKFIGEKDGGTYDIPFTMYKETVEKVDLVKQRLDANKERQKIIGNMKEGDYFYINKNGNALVFRFKEVRGNRIIGINPIGNAITRIDMSFEIGLLK